MPRPDDVFQERLYCIRWVKGAALGSSDAAGAEDEGADENDKLATRGAPRRYAEPTEADLAREARVLDLLRERFTDWQAKGYIPSRRIEPGDKTGEPIRTRGWTHWHHLFTPRQLLVHGLVQEFASQLDVSTAQAADLLLGRGRSADWDSKLCRWGTGAARESIAQTFYNQAFNALYNFPGKALPHLWGNYAITHEATSVVGQTDVHVADCRSIVADTDYQLAAYAAALRVVTQYRVINGEDVEQALSRPRWAGEQTVIETIIEEAVRTASNYLIPSRLAEDESRRRDLWRALAAEERFYLKGLEVESHDEYRTGVYQELARGFGLREYRPLLYTGKANETRLATATEMKRKELGTAGFGASLLRHVLFAVHKTLEAESADAGHRWLQDETPSGYWARRTLIVALLRYLAGLPIGHWAADVDAARILAGRIENEHT